MTIRMRVHISRRRLTKNLYYHRMDFIIIKIIYLQTKTKKKTNKMQYDPPLFLI